MGLVMVVIAAVVLYFVPTAVMRTFDPHTKLGLFEDSIQGVATEFMRRSPALRANWDEFRSCVANKCDYAPILARRDRIIAQEWPAIYDRVSIKDDWWSFGDIFDDKFDDREAFFQDLDSHTPGELRDRCVPNIVYSFNRGGTTTFNTVGFICPTKKPDRRSG